MAYLTKDISSKELTEAIKKILGGERYLSSSITDLITNELRDNQKGTGSYASRLTPCQYSVFGIQYSVISRRLGPERSRRAPSVVKKLSKQMLNA